MADDRRLTIAALEEQLRRTPRGLAPYEHALVSHRLGVCYAESDGRPSDGLHRALEYFDQARLLLDPRFHPVEHARVLTAAGAVQRSMGASTRALALFTQAQELAADRVDPAESAAMSNNVGLALLDLGSTVQAGQRFDFALALFDSSTAQGRRGRASALHNRGLAHATSGNITDLELALQDYDRALHEVTFEEAPLHHGLIQHSRGVVAATLIDTTIEPQAAEFWRQTAIEAFTVALDVFVWPSHAIQHAMTNFNAGRMWARGQSVSDLRRAQLCFEDAVTAFDPRLHAEAWRQAYVELEKTDGRLAVDHPDWTRADHLVELLTDGSAAERVIQGRLARWLALPEQGRAAALASFVAAAFGRDERVGGRALVEVLKAAMELPIAAQETVLEAMINVRGEISDHAGRARVDTFLEHMIGEAVVGPQRMFVRDYLAAGGFERP